MWLFRRGKQQADLAAYLDLTGATTSRKIAGKAQWSVTDLIVCWCFCNLFGLLVVLGLLWCVDGVGGCVGVGVFFFPLVGRDRCLRRRLCHQ